MSSELAQHEQEGPIEKKRKLEADMKAQKPSDQLKEARLELQKERNEFETERKLFEQSRDLVPKGLSRRKVKLNVGGVCFTTSLDTLRSDRTSMLAAMFSGDSPHSNHPDEDGEIFIDRDGTHFRFILNFLRDNRVELPRDDTIRNEILKEARYYRISGLTNYQLACDQLQKDQLELAQEKIQLEKERKEFKEKCDLAVKARLELETERKEFDTVRFEFDRNRDMVPKGLSRDKVKLNVGGVCFTTSLDTLRSDRSSMLAAMFSGNFADLNPDEDGEIFIDRDGTHFRYILNFLRDNRIELPKDELLRNEILNEGTYYGIEGLSNALCCADVSHGSLPCLTQDELNSLRVDNYVDHRDLIGKWIAAQIVSRREDSVQVHYVEWAPKWDRWVDLSNSVTPARFAKFQTLSTSEKNSPLNPYKIGDFVLARPLRNVSWQPCEVRKLDKRQLQVRYTLDGRDRLHWVHCTDADEVKPMGDPLES